jgi:hypothetical protein
MCKKKSHKNSTSHNLRLCCGKKLNGMELGKKIYVTFFYVVIVRGMWEILGAF